MRTTTRVALAAAAASALMIADPAAYVHYGPKWGTFQVPYYINPANADVSASAAITAIQAGANAWNSQTNANLQLYYVGQTSGSTLSYNGKNEVFFRNTSNGSVIAEAYWWYNSSYKLVDADIVFYDGGFKFFTGSSGCSSGLYIEDTAVHEFGHAIGLGHTSVAGATMTPKTSLCATSGRTLEADDIAGVEALYPPSSTTPDPTPSNASPTVSITKPSTGTSFQDGTTITFAGSASDSEDGAITSKLSWTSNLSGQIGTGGSFSKVLPVGTHTISATAFDSGGASGTKQVVVVVAATTSTPTGLTLTARGYKVNRRHRVDLTWKGATSRRVDIYRNGVKVLRTPNDGVHTDAMDTRGQATYTYKVCKAGTLTCSNTTTVVF
jgi:hypothetical protein